MGFPGPGCFRHPVPLGGFCQSLHTGIFSRHLAGTAGDAGNCPVSDRTKEGSGGSYADSLPSGIAGILWNRYTFPAKDPAVKRRSDRHMDHPFYGAAVCPVALPGKPSAGDGSRDRKAETGAGGDHRAGLPGAAAHLWGQRETVS